MSALADALDVLQGDLVAFVGAGGKTSAIIRLARELAGQGRKVVVTTTTHMREPSFGQVAATILEPDGAALLKLLPGLLRKFAVVAVASGYAEAAPGEAYRKLAGISPILANAIAALPGVDNVLVEADGARGRSLKAPAGHEPVVPSCTSLLVPVAALDALAHPLAEPTVHRPEIAAGLAGIRQGEPVTPWAMAAILSHAQGGLKGRPPSARVVPLLNKVDDAAGRQLALQVARLLLRWPSIDHVVLGAVGIGQSPASILPVERLGAGVPISDAQGPRIAAVVLAAGASRRFGSQKQLLPVAGRTMVARVTAQVLATRADDVLVVVGSQAGETVRALAGMPVRSVLNPEWDEGMASSMQTGLRALPPQTDAVLFVLADQISLTTEEVDSVIGAYMRARTGRVPQPLIVVPVHQGRRGNPVLFDRALFGELAAVTGDQGGRALLDRHAGQVVEVAVPTPGVLKDVDTPDDIPAWAGGPASP